MKKSILSLMLFSSSMTSTLWATPAEDAYRLGKPFIAGENLQKQDPVSEYYLGKLRLYGYGLLKNNPLAIEYFTAAANKGYLPAEQLLARYNLIAKRDPSTALTWFKKAADAGDNLAQMYCAAAYLFGYGTDKNPDQARKYYIEAAKNGDPLAQYTLGSYFINQRDKNSRQLGLIWLAKSAKLGNARAQDLLGVAELNGTAGEPDPKEAKSWFEDAAKSGLNSAIIHLAEMAITDKQYARAQELLKQANNPINAEAQLALAKLYLIPDTQIFNPKLAFDLTETLAKDKTIHSDEAALLLSTLFKDGTGVPQNPAAAAAWAKTAQDYAKISSKPSAETIVNWLSSGKTKDIKQSSLALNGIYTDWNNKTVQQNGRYNQAPEMPGIKQDELFKPQYKLIDPKTIPLSDYFEHINSYSSTNYPTIQDAPQYPLYPTFERLKHHDSPVISHDQDETALIYPDTLLNETAAEPDILVQLGLVPNDLNKRLHYQNALLELYDRAILGDSAAQFELGQLYQAGIAVRQNVQQAIKYYELAATQQEIRAEYNLGLLYLSGQTDPVDYEKGIDWLLDAAFKGNENAQYVLGSLYQRGLNNEKGETLIEPNIDQAVAMYYLATANALTMAEYQLASVLLKQDQTNFNVSQKHRRQQFIKQLYQDSANKGIAAADLPLAFYQAMSSKQEEQDKAFMTAYQQASNGNKSAALLLAMLYDRGIGVAQDKNNAIKWYEEAVNHPVGAFILGTEAAKGAEGPNNIKKAKELLSFAANQNLAYADYNLAILKYLNNEPYLDELLKAQQEGSPIAGLLLADAYINQPNTQDNLKKAKDLYSQFAEKGDPMAATKLAYLYDNGIGMAADYKTAEKWYNVAASQRQQPLAQFLLGQFYQTGHIDNEENIPKAKAWYQKAIQNGSKTAPVALGYVNENFDENYQEAKDAYSIAANDNNPIALYNLGLMKEYGKGEPVNIKEALDLYQRAANQEHVGAMTQLASLYLKGEGVDADRKLAFNWYEKAAAKNNPEALYQLALMLLKEKNQDYKLAAQYFEKSMNQGHELALLQLADMLYEGKGIPKDEAKALNLYTQAANNNNSDAAIALARIAIKQGKIQQAKKWIEQAKQANNPATEQLLNSLENITKQSLTKNVQENNQSS